MRAAIASDDGEAPPRAARPADAPSVPPALALAVVLIGGALLYVGALDAPYVFDDLPGIVENAAVQPPVDWGALFRFMPARAVAMASFALNLSLGDSPASLRVVNIAIHLVASALVFALVLLLLERRRGRRPTDVALATLAAAVFVAHPLQTQAVTYVWQRVASLAGMLYLAALVLHFAALRRRQHDRSWAPQLGLALGVGLLGMFTKQIVFTLPLAVVLLSALTGDRRALAQERALWLPWLPLLAVIPLTIALFGDMQVADIEAAGEEARTPWGYFLTQWQVIALYWRLTLLPFGQSLVHDLPTGSLSSAATWACGLLHLTVLGLAAGLRARLPLVSAGLLFFYLALGVESSFVPLVDEAFEHRLYLPLVGVTLALVGVVDALLERRGAGVAPTTLVAGALLFALPLGGLTTARNALWSDPLALWVEAADNAPEDFTAQLNAGLQLSGAGQPEVAVRRLEAARRLRPSDAKVSTQLGVALCLSGRCAEGVSLLETVWQRSQAPQVRDQYVTALAQLGRFGEAADLMGEAPPTGPRGAALYAKLLIDAGRPAQAATHLRSVIAAAPPGAAGSEQMRALEALLAEATRLSTPTPDDTDADNTDADDTDADGTGADDTDATRSAEGAAP